MKVVKFNDALINYRYILSFDLAKEKTGWAIVDTYSNLILDSGLIIRDPKAVSGLRDQYNKIRAVIQKAKSECDAPFFVFKEKLPCQNGRATTIATLQALAAAHAAWELACVEEDVDVYDFEGIHSISVKALYRHRLGIEKPTKEDIAKAVCEDYNFNLGDGTYDITDAIACVAGLIHSKWNNDIAMRVRDLKKEIKKYKANSKSVYTKNIELYRIQSLVIEDSQYI